MSLLADSLVVALAHVLGDRLVEPALVVVARKPRDRHKLRAARPEQRLAVRVHRPPLLGANHIRLHSLASHSSGIRKRLTVE